MNHNKFPCRLCGFSDSVSPLELVLDGKPVSFDVTFHLLNFMSESSSFCHSPWGLLTEKDGALQFFASKEFVLVSYLISAWTGIKVDIVELEVFQTEGAFQRLLVRVWVQHRHDGYFDSCRRLGSGCFAWVAVGGGWDPSAALSNEFSVKKTTQKIFLQNEEDVFLSVLFALWTFFVETHRLPFNLLALGWFKASNLFTEQILG